MRDQNISTGCGSSRKRADELKDEVYRQMFRVEAGRPGAAGQLAVALLRAWSVLDASPRAVAERAWLRKICPICIGLLEAAGGSTKSGNTLQRPI